MKEEYLHDKIRQQQFKIEEYEKRIGELEIKLKQFEEKIIKNVNDLQNIWSREI